MSAKPGIICIADAASKCLAELDYLFSSVSLAIYETKLLIRRTWSEKLRDLTFKSALDHHADVTLMTLTHRFPFEFQPMAP